MRTNPDCLPCLLRQTCQVVKLIGSDERTQVAALQQIAAMLAEVDLALSPPANAGPIYAAIASITGCIDPYSDKKKISNRQALAALPAAREKVRQAEDELVAAVRFAIAGNIIDYGALEEFDLQQMLDSCLEEVLVVDHTAKLADRLAKLKKGDRVCYLTDNCGEIVFDTLLLDYLARRGLLITVAVKGGPIINDALAEDALEVGLDRYGKIITNETSCPGTVLAQCGQSFLREFTEADLIISKGQGNFESLSDEKRDIFCLLTVKCPAAARHLEQLTGLQPGTITGKGEMAVYFHQKGAC
ncbi:damage-control phosphatase ARMT1 family protein [Desulforhopalus singaporensis]|uniref:Damage-control phosphatase ARMT1-like metal-binding domain-containing protein n=1 Tax=Desulforhopalus singaporensis TaxID=91360 RepID=A0A1H0V6I5_9BACT|nr:ARMT1-like domain-containing protein [Desulforhopalus singaporensis]SDP73778.1 hypothetical protein SAMN05660330_03891 [Desulforhopalus singaporensis]